jgi:hypothetical protein
MEFFDNQYLKNRTITRNPYLLFSPFLLFFITYAVKFHSNALIGDEGGYVFFANNLLKGYFSPPAPDINLWWGPGYPIILMPFIGFRLPLIFIPLMNAAFQYLSIVFLFKASSQLANFRKAFVVSLLWALCYSAYTYIPLILTEPFTAFLISLLVFELVRVFNPIVKRKIYLAGMIIGYLALTKIIFGYVIPIILTGSIFLWLLNRKAQNYRKTVLIMLVAFITTLPYLAYTYNLTGKVFYFGNSGGMSLYWMSTPYENEYGDWNNESFTDNQADAGNPERMSKLKSNHQKDIDQVFKFKGIEKDEAYKKIAIQNIKSHPMKYVKNIFSNISRSFFGFPQTYSYQTPLLKVWYFAILFSLILFCLSFTLFNWKRIIYPVRFLLVFIFVYFAGSSLISIDNRQFVIIVPAILFWIGYILQKTTSVKLKFSGVKND